MRVLIRIGLLTAAVLTLVSCTRIVSGPADELKMYSWRGEAENASVAELSFEDTNGSLTIENGGDSLTISGLCFADDDRFIICDEESGQNYTFGYRLHGDRVELSRDGGVLVLDKVETS